MSVSFLVAVHFQFLHARLFDSDPVDWLKLVIGVAITTATWLAVAFLTAPTEERVLRSFYRLIRPSGPGWGAVLARAEAEGVALREGPARNDLTLGLACMALGCVAVYASLFATGLALYGRTLSALALAAIAAAATAAIVKLWRRLETKTA
jgi:hypothetical protein